MIEKAYVIPYDELVKFASTSDEDKFTETLGKLLGKADYILVKKGENEYLELKNPEDIKIFYRNLKDKFGIGYFDGASVAGKGGIGIVIKLPDKKVKLSKYIGKATSNEAEYTALIELLKKAKELGLEKLLVLGDSELVINQLKGRYKVRNERLKKLFNEVKRLERAFKRVDYEWIPREKNREADELSREALQGSSL